MSRSLGTLPARLVHYKITRPTQVPAEDNKCISCWRPFNTVEDKRDLTERPCRPIRIKPCNHLIGSVCLDELIQRSITICPYCAAPLTATSTIPLRLNLLICNQLFLLPMEWLYFADGTIDDSDPELISILEPLYDKLFEGSLTTREALQLWCFYMLAALTGATLALLLYFCIKCCDALATRLADMLPLLRLAFLFISFGGMRLLLAIMFLARAVAYPISSLLLSVVNIAIFSPGNVFLQIMMWLAGRFLGYKVAVALLGAIVVLYGELVAYLIWLGMTRKRMVL